MNSGNNTLLVAGSIIAAGIVIALGIILAGSGSGGAINTGTDGGNVSFDIMPLTKADHIRGNSDASVIMVEYSDVGCIHCQNLHNTLTQIMDEYEDDQFAWVFRHFPLRAPAEASAAECVANLGGEDAFWSYIDELMIQAQQRTPDGDTDRLAELAVTHGVDREAFVTCQEDIQFEDRIQEMAADARDAGAQGTPFNVFVLENPITETQRAELQAILGGAPIVSEEETKMIIPGGLPFDMLKAVIDTLLPTEQDTEDAV